jgi:ankyrin repeat protein
MSVFKRKPESSPLSRLRLAVKSSDTMGVREILGATPDLLNHRDEKGATPLHWAAEVQDLSVVAALIDLGADVNIKDNLGYTPGMLRPGSGNFAWARIPMFATRLFNVSMSPRINSSRNVSQ